MTRGLGKLSFIHLLSSVRTEQLTCFHCGKVSSKEVDTLLVHLKSCPSLPRLHPTRRPCFACAYVARDAYDLRKHLRIHTNEKPFACLVCKYRFKQISTALNHMKKQHQVIFMKSNTMEVVDVFDE